MELETRLRSHLTEPYLNIACLKKPGGAYAKTRHTGSVRIASDVTALAIFFILSCERLHLYWASWSLGSFDTQQQLIVAESDLISGHVVAMEGEVIKNLIEALPTNLHSPTPLLPHSRRLLPSSLVRSARPQ